MPKANAPIPAHLLSKLRALEAEEANQRLSVVRKHLDISAKKIAETDNKIRREIERFK